MSAHAISCRRDLFDLVTLLVELLSPLFAFLIEAKPTRKTRTLKAIKPVTRPTVDPTTRPEGEGTVPPGTVEGDDLGESGVPGDTPASKSESPTVATVPTMPTIAPPVALEAPEADTPVIVDTMPSKPTTEKPEARKPETLFVKVSGRYLPARTGSTGPKFRRVMKGNKPRFVPLPSTPSEKPIV